MIIKIKQNGENVINENVSKEVFNEFLGLLDLIGEDNFVGPCESWGAYDSEYIYTGDTIRNAEIVGVAIEAETEEWFDNFEKMLDRAKRFKTIRRSRKAA